MTLAFESATELAAGIRRGAFSARELTEYFIARIERWDRPGRSGGDDKAMNAKGAVNAVVVPDFDRAVAAADAADRALAAGQAPGPLHGVPMTVKESYDIQGLATTWGLAPMRGNIAAADAEVVKRLKAAGAHFLGKTNVPPMLGDFQASNDIYGRTGNPWDLGRTPGGSSGGSAAALAAGLTALECGSDIGGSVRNPAHYCGVYGHKPTWGVVPVTGHALPGMVAPPDLAVMGPLARSADDLALALRVIGAPQPLDAPGWRLELPAPRRTRLSDYRVAVWPTDPRAPVAGEIADRVQALADRLARAGATVSDRVRPDIDLDRVWLTYLHLLNGVMAGGMADDEFAAAEERARSFAPDDVSQPAAVARSVVQSHRDWSRFNQERERLRMAWRAFFDDWDILICPQMASTAFPHDARPFEERFIDVDGQQQPYFQQVFWSGLVTVAYLPSTVFPTGPSAAGLPIGLQAIGAEFDDYQCIDFARLLAEAGGAAFESPPGYQD